MSKRTSWLWVALPLLWGCGAAAPVLTRGDGGQARIHRARPFFPGERLSYRARIGGVDAANATLSVGRIGHADGRDYLPLRITVQGYDWLTRFYPLKIKFISWVDPDTLRPIRMDREGTNGSVPRTMTLLFGPKGRVMVSLHVQGKKPRRFRRRTTPDAFGLVSGLYEIRAWLMTGEAERDMVVFNGAWSRKVHVVRGPVEEVWTPMGWFEARRFEVTTVRFRPKGDPRRIPEKKRAPESFTAWVTEDERLIPVKLLGQTPVGPAEVLLDGVVYKRE